MNELTIQTMHGVETPKIVQKRSLASLAAYKIHSSFSLNLETITIEDTLPQKSKESMPPA